MVSLEEIRNLYETQLRQELLGLEKERKKVQIWYNLSYIVAFIPIMIFTLFFLFGAFYFFLSILFSFPSLRDLSNSYDNSANNGTLFSFSYPVGFFLFLLYFVSPFVFQSIGNRKKKVYQTIYKKEVVSWLVHAINPEWSYQPDAYISEQEYLSSNLLLKPEFSYKGDDLISGVIENTDFRCSELYVAGISKNKKDRNTIFKGLFFHADFNKVFSGQTYIIPSSMESLGKWVGIEMPKTQEFIDVELVKMENSEFKKYFKVYATDQTEARYILTPTIMEALVKLRKKYNRRLYLSFSNKRVYCAFSFIEDLFEPKVFKSGVNFSYIETMYNLFTINAVIIKELNLNTRIWTKK